MIQLLRVDHRLIHGQVALSWVKSLEADSILVANDDIPSNELRKSTLKLARPNDIKLVIKNVADSIQVINSGKTDNYRVLIIVESIHDAYRITQECPGIKAINLGGTRHTEGTYTLSRVVFINDQEVAELDELASKGVEIEIRAIASDRPISYVQARKALA